MINTVESAMGLHRIMCRNTLDQGLFFYIQGAIRANPAVNIRLAVIDFCDHYNIPCEYETMRKKYYKMLREYVKDHTTFKEQISSAVYEYECDDNSRTSGTWKEII